MTDKRVPSVGISLLSVMVALVGILALMLVLSHLLRTTFTGVAGAGTELVVGLSLAGVAYLLLAYGLWKFKRWTRQLALWLLPVLTTAGLLDAAGNKVMALSTILIFALGFLINLLVLLALHRPETRALFTR